MKKIIIPLLLLFSSCTLEETKGKDNTDIRGSQLIYNTFPKGSWQDFLQHLPSEAGQVVTYRGEAIANQDKAAAVIKYDIGTKDLQQCADALIRLRAEYLFAANRKQEIAFHFTSGNLFSFQDYCSGLRPAFNNKQVSFNRISAPGEQTHDALRRYLDIIYTYAGTISLAKELRHVTELTVGTVIIKPGSPGHCSLVCDEATTNTGEKVYKLVEGYTPAQSIYIVRNPNDPSMGAWQAIKTGETIQTASYVFSSYKLGVFE